MPTKIPMIPKITPPTSKNHPDTNLITWNGIAMWKKDNPAFIAKISVPTDIDNQTASPYLLVSGAKRMRKYRNETSVIILTNPANRPTARSSKSKKFWVPDASKYTAQRIIIPLNTPLFVTTPRVSPSLLSSLLRSSPWTVVIIKIWWFGPWQTPYFLV